MSDFILTINAGSNSLKCAAYERNGKTLRWHFEADRIHEGTNVTIIDPDGAPQIEDQPIKPGYENALKFFQKWLEEQDSHIVAAGHRIVHGGFKYDEPTELSDTVIEDLEHLIPFAPSHQPHNIKLVDIIGTENPDMPQIACFDTSFHSTQPWLARQFALPRELVKEHKYERYGFHGLSYEYIAGVLPEHLGEEQRRVLVVHLGSGASACAMLNGQSIATTMSLTALDGLMMSTRCGDLDPGLVLDLIKNRNMSAKDVKALLYEQSGLKGVSGISADMRDVEESDTEEARQAVDLFCYMAARQLGGLVTVMGGMDALVFTGAMGAGNPMIRTKICDYFEWLSLKLEPQINETGGPVISALESPIKVLALPTDEESVIAGHTADIINPQTEKEKYYG